MERAMSKKSEFLRDEQSRARHPERQQVGSPADVARKKEQADASADRQEAGTGKLANDHNKVGNEPPTQKNQGRRTPASRHDRLSIGPGPQNQVSARKGGGGAGRGPRGSG
jgi:hypothetical protein